MMGAQKVDNVLVSQSLFKEFGSTIRSIDESYETLDIVVEKKSIIEVIAWLKNHASLQFNFLTSLCGMHFPEKKGEELAVVYHLHSLTNNIRIRIHTYLDQNEPNVPTLTQVFVGANWMERETYEFFGIKFIGHPDLRIILNVEDMDYYPLLRQYPLIDDSRLDKDDKYFGR